MLQNCMFFAVLLQILKVQILKGDDNKNHSYKENIKVFVNVTIFHSTTRWSCNFINNVTTTDTSIDKKKLYVYKTKITISF